MERIEYELSKTSLNRMNLESADFDEVVRVETNFALTVDKSTFSLLELTCTVDVFPNDDERSSLSLEYSGFFDTNNTKKFLSIDEVENFSDLVNEILPEISDIVSYISEKSIGTPLKLPRAIAKEALSSLDNQK